MAPPIVRKGHAKQDAKQFDGDFFQFPPSLISIVIVVMLVFYWFVCYDMEAVPLHAMGPFGQFVLYLGKNHIKLLRLGFRFTLMLHVMEAAFAYRICRQMMFSHTTSFKWVVQTAVLGFPSLGLLLRHRKDRDLAKRKDE